MQLQHIRNDLIKQLQQFKDKPQKIKEFIKTITVSKSLISSLIKSQYPDLLLTKNPDPNKIYSVKGTLHQNIQNQIYLAGIIKQEGNINLFKYGLWNIPEQISQQKVLGDRIVYSLIQTPYKSSWAVKQPNQYSKIILYEYSAMSYKIGQTFNAIGIYQNYNQCQEQSYQLESYQKFFKCPRLHIIAQIPENIQITKNKQLCGLKLLLTFLSDYVNQRDAKILAISLVSSKFPFFINVPQPIPVGQFLLYHHHLHPNLSSQNLFPYKHIYLNNSEIKPTDQFTYFIIDNSDLKEGELNEVQLKNVWKINQLIEGQLPIQWKNGQTFINVKMGGLIIKGLFKGLFKINQIKKNQGKQLSKQELITIRDYVIQAQKHNYFCSITKQISEKIQEDYLKCKKQFPKMNLQKLMIIARGIATIHFKQNIQFEDWLQAKQLLKQ